MNFLRRYAVILPLSAAISFLTVSCGESKVSQCQKVINVANKTVSEAKTFTNGGQKTDYATMLKAADAMNKSAQVMAGIKVSDEKIKDYQSGFIKMYRDASIAISDLGGALQKKNRPAFEASQQNLTQATRPEPELVTGLNTYCNTK
ncbi:MAG: hypothetical protein NVS2B14_04400 [Chamaesiphon sp.]